MQFAYCCVLLTGFTSAVIRRQHWMSHEERVVVETAIHAAGNFCGFRAEGRASALQEDYDDDSCRRPFWRRRQTIRSGFPRVEQVPVLPRISSSLKLTRRLRAVP